RRLLLRVSVPEKRKLRFSSFESGSCAVRFWGQLGPDEGPVPGPTGPTGRSGPVLTTLGTLEKPT
ncbi:hypothetical protein A2U01_0067320, partial [Trifolium medium]|nr:hypothetical protein [Trifolium medium]